MMNNKDHTEDIIRKLVQKSELESPSDGFTDNIMNKIQTESQLEEVKPVPGNNLWYWIIVAIPVSLLVGVALYYFRLDFAGLFNFDYFTQTLIPYTRDLFGRVSDIMSNQEFSPILMVVLISVGFLMIIERALHFGKGMKSYLFII
ncbi:MAG: hypothetical protein K8S00_02115 [Bacteroidales bacterium]|nr:hypothetical protein [Bacteroidales bacterium]